MKVRAPRLQGRGWLNTGGVELTLAGLRGKFVLLDFWTFACVNCLHVIEELRPLQERFADVLVTVGVHSPKFAHEGDPQAVIDAVERYRVEHPVLDDPDLLTWDAYAAKAWPTLVLIDPAGYVVAQVAGERHAPELAELIERLSAVHEADGSLRRGGEFYRPPAFAGAGLLRFPGGLLVLPPDRFEGGGLLVSSTADQQLVILDPVDLSVELARIGTGERASIDSPDVADPNPNPNPDPADPNSSASYGPTFADPAPSSALPNGPAFADPLGAVLLPADVAQRAGYDVLIADSAGNALRGLRLADLSVRTVARHLSTPWDVAWFGDHAVIAMAGVHQLWSFDPLTGATGVLAGTAREGLVDGPAAKAWFAQPSGLAGAGDGLWVADAETSALRLLWSADDDSLQVRTVIGQGLFEFGQQDGAGDAARLQHPLGVAVLLDGSVAVADTYNGAIRRYEPEADRVSTLAEGLSEPSALVLLDGDLVVAESAAHRLTRLPLPAEVRPGPQPRIGGEGGPIRRPVIDLAPGAVELAIRFEPPPGEHLDDRCGDPTRLDISAVPPEVLLSGGGAATGLARTLVLADRVSGGRVEGVLLIGVQAASCDAADQLGAACHLHRQTWQVPFRLVPTTATALELTLQPALRHPPFTRNRPRS